MSWVGGLLWKAFASLPAFNWLLFAELGRHGIQRATGGMVEARKDYDSATVTYILPSGRSYGLRHIDLLLDAYGSTKRIWCLENARRAQESNSG